MSKRSRREKRRKAKAARPARPPAAQDAGVRLGDVGAEVARGVGWMAWDWLVGRRPR